MIQKCKVIARNAINMVVIFDGIELQIPTNGACDDYIFVKNIDKGFVLSSENEFENSNRKKQKKPFVAELADANKGATDKINEE